MRIVRLPNIQPTCLLLLQLIGLVLYYVEFFTFGDDSCQDGIVVWTVEDIRDRSASSEGL